MNKIQKIIVLAVPVVYMVVALLLMFVYIKNIKEINNLKEEIKQIKIDNKIKYEDILSIIEK